MDSRAAGARAAPRIAGAGRAALAAFAAFAACLSAPACARGAAGYPYSAHRVDAEASLAAREPGPLPDLRGEAGARIPFPVAGAASHHLLASGCIDEWFSELASRRGVSTFVILSPRHFPVGSSPIAFSPLDWETGLGRVAADRALADRLRRAVGAAWDPWSFHGEHGVGSLLPFIAKRFPRARVVPIVLEIEGRKADALAELGRALAAEAMRNKGIFVLVSADFSHHAGPELTAERDGRSRAALLGLDSRTARDIYSDDPAGIRALCEMLDILGRRGGEILRHATAQDLVGEREDVTSYFFCYF